MSSDTSSNLSETWEERSTGERLHMSNSGDGPLQVPGFGNIPLDYELPPEERFAHGYDEWYQVPGVTLRESAMVAAMNVITDKPDWHIGILDDAIAESWRTEAEAAYPRLEGREWSADIQNRQLLSRKAWDWCKMELRDKAKTFEPKQFVRVLDTGSCVCKSDTLVPISYAETLKAGLVGFYGQTLRERLTPQKDGTLDAVDPCLCPLIYGKTPILQDGQTLDSDMDLDGYSRTEPAPEHENKLVVHPSMQAYLDGEPVHSRSGLGLWIRSRTSWSTYKWSSNFQWLPCEASFVGEVGAKIRISTYVNDLHPKHDTIYRSLEGILSRSIEMWNECLVKGMSQDRVGLRQDHRYGNDQRQLGRVPLRIVSYGIRSSPVMPEWAIHFDGNQYKAAIEKYLEAKELAENPPEQKSATARRALRKAEEVIEEWAHISRNEPSPSEKIASPTPLQWEMAQQFLQSAALGSHPLPIDWKDHGFQHFEERIKSVRGWDYPEPGDAVSYDDWHVGNNVHRAVVEKADLEPTLAEDIGYAACDPLHQSYAINLKEQFRDSGLQVIVRIGGFEIGPHTPTKASDEAYERWQMPGRLNDHIVATAIYVYDVTNVGKCRLDLRQAFRPYSFCYRYSDRPPGCPLRSSLWPIGDHRDVVLSMLNIKHTDVCTSCNNNGTYSYQDVGSISMAVGRLFTFPNVMEHRFTLGQLIDSSKPGHCRFVTLYLVDPHYRVCSTRNVPPQQHEWWAEVVSDVLVKKGLPQQLADQICSTANDWPMSEAQALLYQRQQSRERRLADLARWRQAGTLRF